MRAPYKQNVFSVGALGYRCEPGRRRGANAPWSSRMIGVVRARVALAHLRSPACSTCLCPPQSWVQAADDLQEELGRLKAAKQEEEWQYLMVIIAALNMDEQEVDQLASPPPPAPPKQQHPPPARLEQRDTRRDTGWRAGGRPLLPPLQQQQPPHQPPRYHDARRGAPADWDGGYGGSPPSPGQELRTLNRGSRTFQHARSVPQPGAMDQDPDDQAADPLITGPSARAGSFGSPGGFQRVGHAHEAASGPMQGADGGHAGVSSGTPPNECSDVSSHGGEARQRFPSTCIV